MSDKTISAERTLTESNFRDAARKSGRMRYRIQKTTRPAEMAKMEIYIRALCKFYANIMNLCSNSTYAPWIGQLQMCINEWMNEYILILLTSFIMPFVFHFLCARFYRHRRAHFVTEHFAGPAAAQRSPWCANCICSLCLFFAFHAKTD